MLSQSFESFYKKAKNKADEALNAVVGNNAEKGQLQGKAIQYLRENLPASDKSLFQYIAALDEEKKNLLKAKKQSVKISLENLAKNIINHPEIMLAEYLALPELVAETDVLIYIPEKPKETEKIYCFTNKEKSYAAIIKTTRDKEENYVQSFHFTDIKSLEGVKKRKHNKVIYDNNKKR